MVLSWLGGGKQPASVSDLIARRKYGKAGELLMAQFRAGDRDPRLRLQLADVLVLEGKGPKSIPILIGVADEFAREGFAAKSIAVLKKIEKIEPGRADVEHRLAGLIKQRQDEPPTLARRLKTLPEMGIDESAFEPSARDAESLRPITGEEPEPAQPEAAEAPETAAEAGELDFLPDLPDLPDLSQEPPSEAPLKSPLFSDFTEDELVAVIHGLRLLSYEPGDIILTEGEPGDSLFILTTGFVKAFVRNPAGRHIQVREIPEGDFFGEISILTGKPRTATVTAGAHCELLELDRPTLDSITETHPRVLEVLKEFQKQRANSAPETMARNMAFGEARRRLTDSK